MLARTAPNDAAPALPKVHWYNTVRSLDNTRWTMNIAASDVPGAASNNAIARREIDYVYEEYDEGDMFNPEGWRPIPFTSINLAAQRMKTIWPLGLRDMLASGARINFGQTVEFINQGSSALVRIRFLSDNVVLNRTREQLEQDSNEFYHGLRSIARSEVITQYVTPGSNIEVASRTLDDAEALIDAYASVAYADVFGHSQIVRSALRRAEPSATKGYIGSEFGIRAADARVLLFHFDQGDSDPGAPGERSNDFTALASDHLLARSLLLRREFEGEVGQARQTSPTVLWTLKSLRSLRDNASRLAADDAYASFGEGLTRSVLENDAHQLYNILTSGRGVILNYRPIEVDLASSNPDGGGAYQDTSLGRVTFELDVTFDYTPNPGATGVDVFSYRARCDISDGVGNPVYVYSLPAFVRVNVGPASCPADLAEPFGTLDFSDVFAFLVAFGAMDAPADLAEPYGAFDFSDVFAFLIAFGDGCP
ncbi:MAG: GC-type dockerin domain-anchored protein [Phycisphaerales bacterium]